MNEEKQNATGIDLSLFDLNFYKVIMGKAVPEVISQMKKSN